MPETPSSAAGHRTLAQRERAALADLLDAVGPDAPTLCAGWGAGDLVAHLVLREGHPAAIGIVLRPLAGWTERQQHQLASAPYPATVERFRHGPPAISPMRLPGADAAANTFEYFVHHEDVRRAAASWTPRELPVDDERELWHQLTRRARLFIRKSPVPVRLDAPGFGAVSVGNTDDSSAITLSGAPSELVLYLHGRREQADVTIDGDDDSQRAWQRHTLSV
jgi:uncharacterized protein (TIGR03085 family)